MALYFMPRPERSRPRPQAQGQGQGLTALPADSIKCHQNGPRNRQQPSVGHLIRFLLLLVIANHYLNLFGHPFTIC